MRDMNGPAKVTSVIPDGTRRKFYEERQRAGLSTEGYPYPTSQNPSGYSTSPIVTRVDFEGGTNATTSSTTSSTTPSTTPPSNTPPITSSTTPPSTSNTSEEEKRRIMEQSRQDNQKKKEEEEAKRKQDEEKKKQEQQKAAELASAVKRATYEDKKTAQELTSKAFNGVPDATSNPNAKRVSPPSYEQKQFEIARNLLFNAAQERRRSL